VSPRFDFASKILVATVEEGKVVDRENYSLLNLNPIRRSSLLCELGINVLICGGIHNFSQRLIIGNGIDVIPMVQGEVEEVLKHFIKGELKSSITPMVQERRKRSHRGKRGGYSGTKKD
jgi:predicted Fe-Mo cluster-binding NifX family protein